MSAPPRHGVTPGPFDATPTKRLSRATDDAARWSDRTWRKQIRPALRDMWSRRTIAMGAAGAAVPAGRELVDTAAVRLGLRQQEERHWGAFFLGLLLGAAVAPSLRCYLTPKRGDEMRRELAVKADEVRAGGRHTRRRDRHQGEGRGVGADLPA